MDWDFNLALKALFTWSLAQWHKCFSQYLSILSAHTLRWTLQIHSSLEKAHDEWMETFEHNCKFVPHSLWKMDLFLKKKNNNTFLNVLWYSVIVNCHTPWAVAACSGMQSEKKALTLAVIQMASHLIIWFIEEFMLHSLTASFLWSLYCVSLGWMCFTSVKIVILC